jgi:flavodoxin
MMNIQVRYLSKSGNTKKVAEAIADAVNVAARPIIDPVPPDTDLLFLGGAVYAFGIDEELKRFIDTLAPSIKQVAVFSTTGVVKSAYGHIKKQLAARGITTLEGHFNCHGEFTFMHKGRPNARDLGLARDFAHETIEMLGK